jgi:methylmalonic aciduria homocystinuria type C protein
MSSEQALHALATAGFEIAHVFDAHAVTALGWERLATGPRTGILVGNTRTLWPRFVDATQADTALAADVNKLERYTEQTIAAAFPAAPIYYSHRTYDGAFLPFQRLAVATGLGALAPSQLVIHPEFGPWFALRAVVLLDGEPALARGPIVQPCVCAGPCKDALDRALVEGTWQAWVGVRDACSLRAWRYTNDQVEYHYTHAWPTVDPARNSRR